MSVVLGIISAIVIFFFRESVRLAHEQREIVFRLDGYLTYWKTKTLEDDTIAKFTAVGIKWCRAYADRVKGGCTSEELVAIDEEFKRKIDDGIDIALSDQEMLKKAVQELRQRLIDMPNLKTEIIEHLKDYKKQLIEGRSFISDSEAAKLGHEASFICINFKMELISLIESFLFFVITLEYETEVTPPKQSIKEFSLQWIKLNRDVEMLKRLPNQYSNTSISSIAARNFFSGF